MKKLINKYSIAAVLVGLGLSSCVKKFDPKSYAPPLNVNGYTSADQIAKSNLVAHWAFNGSLADSVSGVVGVAAGTNFSSGLEGQALQGANNAYVVSNTPDGIKNLHSFTVSIWVKMPENTNGAVGLLDIANTQNFWGNLDIFFDNGATATTGVLKVHAWNNSGSSTGVDAWEGGYTVNNPWGGWINVAVTYDDSSSTVIVYYNGSAVGTNTAAGFAPLNWTDAKQIVFGTLQFQTTPSLTTSTGSQGWASFNTGETDEVRVYNRALNSTEVSSLVALQHRGK
jgi:hypothetical protein